MSIVNRIENMTENLANAYDSLENIGVDLTGVNKNLSSLATEIESVYEDLPKTIPVEGELLNIQSTKKGKMLIDLKGNTKQKTLTGKNLFNFTTMTDSQSVATLENGIIKLIWDAGFNLSLNDLVSNLNTSKSYTISFKHRGDALHLRNSAVSETNILETTTDTNYKLYSLTLTDISSFKFKFVRKTNAGTAYIKDFQIEENTEATDYEEYCGGIPSPNPFYPQNVEVVSGNNNIIICGKNFFDKNNAEIIKGTVQATYFAYQPNSLNKTIYLPCLPNTTYTIQKRNDGDTNRFAVASGYIEIDKAEADAITPTTVNELNNDATDITITTGVNDTYLLIMYYRTAEETLTEQQVLDSIQVEVGSTKTTYEAYTSNSYPINLPVENKAIACNGIWFDGNNKTFYSQSQGYGFKALVLPNTTYTISKKNIGNRFSIILSENDVVVGNTFRKVLLQDSDSDRKTYTFTTGATDKYVFFGCYRGTNQQAQQLACEEVQIEEGTKINRYTENGINPIELYKINNLQNYFYKEGNNWYVKEYVKKYVLNKNTDWNMPNSTTLPNMFQTLVPITLNTLYDGTYTQAYSNYFIIGNTNTVRTTNGMVIFRQGSNNYIRVVNTNINNIEAFKTWLEKTKNSIYYITDNSTSLLITDSILINQLNVIEKAKSCENQTNISQTNNDYQFIINASALLKSSN